MRATFIIGWAGHQSETTTTIWLAHEGHRRGHDIAFVDYLDLSMDSEGAVWGRARVPASGAQGGRQEYVAALRATDVSRVARCLSEDDVVFLRNNPADRFSSWVEKVGNPALAFGRVLRAAGVPVINDPDGLSRVGDPNYLLSRCGDLMPRTLISRDTELILAFLRDLDAPAALKPLGSYGGHGVFYLRRRQVTNVRAMIETLAAQGYVVAQQWIEGAAAGDKRILLWRGRPIPLGGGRFSAYLRRGRASEHRHNIHAGGRPFGCTLTDHEQRIAARVGDLMREEGLALVGLDVVAGMVLEVNVFCPGGLHNLHRMYGVDLASIIWRDLEERTT